MFWAISTLARSAMSRRPFQHHAGQPAQRFLLLRMHSVERCDISGINALKASCVAYRPGGDIFMVRVQEPVLQLMQTTGFYDLLGADHSSPRMTRSATSSIR